MNRLFLSLMLLAPVALLASCTQPTSNETQDRNRPTQAQVEKGSSSDSESAEIGDDDGTGMWMYNNAQSLMKAGKRQQGYEAAKSAMQRFIAEHNSLAWMLLESVNQGQYRVDVHYNMDRKSRNPNANGIVKPLFYRIWSKDGSLVRVIDFELAKMDGNILTASIGEQTRTAHLNLGTIDPEASYEDILHRVLDIVENMQVMPHE